MFEQKINIAYKEILVYDSKNKINLVKYNALFIRSRTD